MGELLGLVLSIGFIAGVIGNIVASVIWAAPAFGWLHAKEKARHVAKLAQAAAHHKAQMELMVSQHAEQMALLRKQPDQVPAAKRGVKT
jgi:hypothetical protein